VASGKLFGKKFRAHEGGLDKYLLIPDPGLCIQISKMIPFVSIPNLRNVLLIYGKSWVFPTSEKQRHAEQNVI
jgi:hypothetical protein|tara:strand:- start:4002 stop:4220 length:219 start_codon:yes stop_codon:yes gene_type:complete